MLRKTLEIVPLSRQQIGQTERLSLSVYTPGMTTSAIERGILSLEGPILEYVSK